MTNDIIESFRRMECKNDTECIVAFLKIQSWKFALSTPEVGFGYRESAFEMIVEAFFFFINPGDILDAEGDTLRQYKN